MKKKIISLCFFLSPLLITSIFAQGPGEPYNPMTANGADGISISSHNLIWSNPTNAVYNEIYCSQDSLLVALMNPAVRIYNGYPATLYDSISLNIMGVLERDKKYYWRVVEYDSTGQTVGPIWYFTTMVDFVDYFEDQFSDLSNWTVIGPQGFVNWSIYLSNYAGGQAPELVFRWTPSFNGNSYLISKKRFPGGGFAWMISFKHFLDWYADTASVGFGYTSDNGSTWIPLWQTNATSNIGPETVYSGTHWVPDRIRFGFYFKGYSFNLNYWYIDDFLFDIALSLSVYSPTFLSAQFDTINNKVNVVWNAGWSSIGVTGYRLQRKKGLPTDTSAYSTIIETSAATLSYEDENIQSNEIYTYRICALSSNKTGIWGNEATAYVPNIIPVELQSFNAEVDDNNVKLFWSTSTETNNQGFQIERSKKLEARSEEWDNIGFVNGKGTTTEIQSYTFTDKPEPGKYKYRLKQIDYNGSFAYSPEVEAEVKAPNIFSLEQNYPNPFNPSTVISYRLPVTSNVTLKVYDVLGKKIATLVNEEKPAGKYKVEFTVGQDSSPDIASGVYYYELRSGSFVETKKMILLR